MDQTPWDETTLAKLNRQGNFRLRGEASTRLEIFVDAAFAFAVTMLVISVDDVPRSYDEFIEALLTIPGFIASFFQMMMFWLGHRAWSRRYGIEDAPSLWLSLILVCGILVIVYPLRVLFMSAFGYLTDGLLPYPFDVGWVEMRTIFVIYGLGFGFLCGLIGLLYLHAWRRRQWLALNEVEVLQTRCEIESWGIVSVTGFVGMLIAWLASEQWVVLGGWIYFTLFVSLPLHARSEKLRLQQLVSPATD
ncbi:MAG: TMEM175 family protein [Pseudohongiella sp.]|uniref:TMEM175 family protein n=1 Tax=Pseudohongiella sp. TaxID=1979412 RepID=UPI0034A022B6